VRRNHFEPSRCGAASSSMSAQAEFVKILPAAAVKLRKVKELNNDECLV
jgi:hypothetical protein